LEEYFVHLQFTKKPFKESLKLEKQAFKDGKIQKRFRMISFSSFSVLFEISFEIAELCFANFVGLCLLRKCDEKNSRARSKEFLNKNVHIRL
jgi:hypothetical protein